MQSEQGFDAGINPDEITYPRGFSCHALGFAQLLALFQNRPPSSNVCMQALSTAALSRSSSAQGSGLFHQNRQVMRGVVEDLVSPTFMPPLILLAKSPCQYLHNHIPSHHSLRSAAKGHGENPMRERQTSNFSKI
jgi:hypothetical protein